MRAVSNHFFFFQAEDGIRDYKVTGVQTCALPISKFEVRYLDADPAHERAYNRITIEGATVVKHERYDDKPGGHKLMSSMRSEERRVGKECRNLWATKL